VHDLTRRNRLSHTVSSYDSKPVRMRLKQSAEGIIRRGHPWIFAESIRDQSRPGATGDLAVIYDRRDRFLAAGLFDAESPLRVRVAQLGRPATIDPAFWSARIQTACDRRADLFGRDTTGYRLINGESDGVPGLVLDRYEELLVLKLYTAVWFPHLETVLTSLEHAFPRAPVVLRLARNLETVARERFQLADGQTLHPADVSSEAPPDRVVFRENGLRFWADVRHGQKTGFFLDQRENRARIEKLATGKSVLNCFSFSGGFSLYAARGGARSVTDVDISQHALRSARDNFELNRNDARINEVRHETVSANVFDWLDGGRDRFDLIIIDPPSLAKKAADRESALRAYRQLFASGIRRLAPRGLLLAASCSAHVRPEAFFELVTEVAARSGRALQKIDQTTHAADHPATFAEAKYLKAMFLEARD
jgi:23S rRNA (cytosine1962-C5)-methyltransferase